MVRFGHDRKRRRRGRRSRTARVGAGVAAGLVAGAAAVTVVWRRAHPPAEDEPGG
ncbi:hypothetical protein [Jiangella alkaliphila]|uniref:hypothetical protein n=1 Tax=Jiangella alkaliphila TaxID=419479 RepID=UPI001364C20F|nr:hypothetical protein [Jiangella alkaliphila]